MRSSWIKSYLHHLLNFNTISASSQLLYHQEAQGLELPVAAGSGFALRDTVSLERIHPY